MAQADGVPLAAAVDTITPPRGAALLKRALSTLVLLPVFLAIVMAGPVWLFGATVVLIGGAGQWEFTGMFERAGIRTRRVMGLVGGVVVTASFAWPASERVAFTAALLAVVGQVGDLVESALKRSVGTKDTGHLIPGHGGILDRVDSLLFNTPVLFYYASHGRILTS